MALLRAPDQMAIHTAAAGKKYNLICIAKSLYKLLDFHFHFTSSLFKTFETKRPP
jgi:hypothetical protein